MPLNPPKGEMYPGFHTWNPIRGRCPYECAYCFMRTGRLKELNGYQEPLHLVEKELDTKLGFGKDVFVGSTVDIGCDAVACEWIERVLERCCEADEQASDLFAGIIAGPHRYKGKQGVEHFHGKRAGFSRLPNRYLFQSKNPARFKDFIEWMPANTTLGTTIETSDQKLYERYRMSKAPDCLQRATAMLELLDFKGGDWMGDTMISIEPIMEFNMAILVDWIVKIRPSYVSIGIETKGVFEKLGIPQPSQEKLLRLLAMIYQHTQVRLKPNLRHLPGAYSKEEFVDELIDAGGIWPPYEE